MSPPSPLEARVRNYSVFISNTKMTQNFSNILLWHLWDLVSNNFNVQPFSVCGRDFISTWQPPSDVLQTAAGDLSPRGFKSEENVYMRTTQATDDKKSQRMLAQTLCVCMCVCVCVCALAAQSCPILCNLMDCGSPGFSVRGLLQARILEWVDMPFSGGSSWPRDRTWASRIAGRLFTIWVTRDAPQT